MWHDILLSLVWLFSFPIAIWLFAKACGKLVDRDLRKDGEEGERSRKLARSMMYDYWGNDKEQLEISRLIKRIAFKDEIEKGE